MAFNKKDLILPENVPYMVKLYNYYNCENALFLILHYHRQVYLLLFSRLEIIWQMRFSGVNLWEYIKQNFSSKVPSFHDLDQELEASMESSSCDVSDNESEFSYTDLINEYTSSKSKLDLDQENLNVPSKSDGGDGSSEAINEKCDSTVDLSEFSKKTTLTEDFENICGIMVPKKYVVKWAAQLLLALEKLHSLGIICW